MRCVIRDVLQYVLVLNYGVRCSKKRTSYTLTLQLEAGCRGGSNRSRGSDGIILIQAGGLLVLVEEIYRSIAKYKGQDHAQSG